MTSKRRAGPALLDDGAGFDDFAAVLLDPDRPCPPGLRAWNGSDPGARLAVYRNNVVGSLIEALAATFPVVQQLVGEAFFRAMAGVFVRQSPPRSRVLAHYGEGFAEFVERFAPAQSLPYLADMARLERARVRACHAADAEPVSNAALARALASGDRIGELRLVCHPAVTALNSRHAVVSLWAAHQVAHQVDGDVEPVDVDASECAVVVRPAFEVLVLRAPPGTADFVAAVGQGLALGDAAAAAATAAADFDLAATLSLLLGQGAITSAHFPQDLPPGTAP